MIKPFVPAFGGSTIMPRFVGCSLCLLVLLWLSPQQAVAEETELTSEAVTFKSAGVILSGTIFRPKQPHAAVVIVHGSGQEKRMVGLAALLARKGIVVL